MLEIYGNFWDFVDQFDAIVITTNGYVKKNGEAVMGRGIALEAKERYPWLPENLGKSLTFGDNIPYIFGADYNSDTGKALHIATLPVKPRFGPSGEPGWKARANIDLIRNSTIKLVELLDKAFFTEWKKEHNLPPFKALMPRPGCGNGGLKWEDVKPVIEPILDDRFTVITWE